MSTNNVGTMLERIKYAIRRGMTNADALAYAKAEHPYSTMTLATVNYTRNEMRRKDKSKKIISNREAERRK
jgi:succinate dehydrogenase flavin-adding protein (antitoxin of CptAB toxin-antitoxin module)